MKKTLFLFAFFTVVCLGTTKAQTPYTTALGIRLGWSQGVTLKHFLGKNAIEGILSTRYRGFVITGLYEWQKPLTADIAGLDWFIGLGLHVGAVDRYYYDNKYDHGTAFFGGLDGILGLEYQLPDLPLNIALDFKPAFQFSRWYDRWGYDEYALSIRYKLK